MEEATATTAATRRPNPARKLSWALVAITGAFCLGVVALRRGEPVNAIWIVTAAIAVFVDRSSLLWPLHRRAGTRRRPGLARR